MIYEYKCSDCSQQFEVWAKMSDAPPSACPHCQSAKVERVISATAFALKGTGWYTTDYKRNNGSPSNSAPKTEAAAPATGGGCGSGACGHNHGNSSGEPKA